jgi:excisionase family DNA binding protein
VSAEPRPDVLQETLDAVMDRVQRAGWELHLANGRFKIVVPTPVPDAKPSSEELATATKRLTVSPQEAAEMLGVDRDTILRWVKQGRLAASKLSPRIVRIRVAAIEAMLAQGAL